MRLLLVAAALFGQEVFAPMPQAGDVSPQDPSEVVDEEGPEAQPWTGTLAGGMAEVVRLAASEDTAAALALTDRLLAPDGYQRWRAGLEERGGLTARVVGAIDSPLTWLGLERIPAPDRAEIRFARGLLQLRQGSISEAETELELVRADAGPGELRHGAVYTLGLLDLEKGEVLRQSIPEISGEQPSQPGAGGEEEGPDPLDLARVCYTAAREHFIERLRLDWRHGDTRANVELCVRRLRELDEIEREREEQQEQQEPSDDPPQDGEGEPQEGQEPEPSPEEQDSEPEQDQPMPDEAPEPSESEEQQVPQEEQEMVLTEEQMKQLLEKLRRHQDVGDELKEQLQGRRRVDTERDW